MRKIFLNERNKIIAKATIAHVVTYLACGAFFSQLFSYDDSLFEAMGFKPMDEINGVAIIIGQIIRGILVGMVVWWIKDSIIGKKLGWCKLWAILVILGIINTYGPAHGSIEGLIYLVPVDVPANASLSVFEVLTQPLLFSIIVTFQRKKKQENNK